MPALHAVVDAHLHVWRPDAAAYSWLAEAPELDRRFELAQVDSELDAVGVRDVVLVQAADNVDDTLNMFRVARECPRVAGVVVWVPLHDVAQAERLLDRWQPDHPVVGARHLVHRHPDPDWLLSPAVGRGLELLAARGLTFDVCAETPHLLGLVPVLADRHPQLRLVLDHLGKPPIRDGGWQPWADLLAAAARPPSVSAKLSGLNTAARPRWSGADFLPYVGHALQVFGPDRLMYGGDWPFALLAAQSYEQIWTGLSSCLDGLTEADRCAVLGGTARRVYRLG